MKTFRPDEVGARQRLLHWMIVAASLAIFVFAGTPGLFALIVGNMLLHVRSSNPRGRNWMDVLLDHRASVLAREWKAFLDASHRRAMSLPRRNPPRILGIAVLLASMLGAAAVGEGIGDGGGPTAFFARLCFAGLACAATWLALFGWSRRTPLVFGTDGVRVGEAFVAHATVSDVIQKDCEVVIERGVLPSVVVQTSDAATAKRLRALLLVEKDRADRQREVPAKPLPAAGFREHASQLGWRIRVLEAPSREERQRLLERVPSKDVEELLEETADPALEDDLRGRLREDGERGE
jgi:hypothetical protein